MALVQLNTFDQDYDGRYTYLFNFRNSYAEYQMAYDNVKPLPGLKEGDRVWAKVEMECSEGLAIDESITTFWARYRVLTCDISKIEILP